MRAFLAGGLMLLAAVMLTVHLDSSANQLERDASASEPTATQPTTGPAQTQPAGVAVRRVHVWITGRVQGVGFRDFTAATADRLKVTGWVRNLPDGRVEMIAEGPREQIGKLLEAVHRGPSMAQVRNVQIKDEEPTGKFARFDVTR